MLKSTEPFSEYPNLPVLSEAEGMASYYNNKFNGRKTASGELYDKRLLTAAHRDYPFGTFVRVRAVESGKSVVVRINDRGPRSGNRVIDLSRAAASQLGMIRDGIAQVKVEVIDWGESERLPPDDSVE
jgi:rare lipoprotein A